MVKRDKRALDREALLEQMGKLACAKVNDAVKLAYLDRKSTRLNSSHVKRNRMPSSA